jgi:hypothetical protein
MKLEDSKFFSWSGCFIASLVIKEGDNLTQAIT